MGRSLSFAGLSLLLSKLKALETQFYDSTERTFEAERVCGFTNITE